MGRCQIGQLKKSSIWNLAKIIHFTPNPCNLMQPYAVELDTRYSFPQKVIRFQIRKNAWTWLWFEFSFWFWALRLGLDKDGLVRDLQMCPKYKMCRDENVWHSGPAIGNQLWPLRTITHSQIFFNGDLRPRLPLATAVREGVEKKSLIAHFIY